MEKIRTIIVDDEAEAREGVALLLQKATEIEVISMCKNGIEAIDAINNYEIDLMYLDIQMPLVDGFEVVRSVPQSRLPAIIFTTAYDQYTLKAFEVHAMDYLLKPFTDARFYESLERVIKVINDSKIQQKQQELIRIMSDRNVDKNETSQVISPDDATALNRLIVKEAGQVHFVNLGDVHWIEAYDYYVKIHIAERFYLLRQSMKKLAELLPQTHFIRVHKSSIVNLQYIKRLITTPKGEYEIELTSGTVVKVSRGYREAIKKLIG